MVKWGKFCQKGFDCILTYRCLKCCGFSPGWNNHLVFINFFISGFRNWIYNMINDEVNKWIINWFLKKIHMYELTHPFVNLWYSCIERSVWWFLTFQNVLSFEVILWWIQKFVSTKKCPIGNGRLFIIYVDSQSNYLREYSKNSFRIRP